MQKSIKYIFRMVLFFGNPKNKKRLSVFIVSILLSIFLWFILKLSKTYETQIVYPLKFSELEQNKIINANNDSNLVITIQTTGFKLLTLKYMNVLTPVEIDVSKGLTKCPNKANTYFFITEPLQERIETQFEKRLEIIDIYPDSLFFEIKNLRTKKVPIKFNHSIEIGNQYQIYDNFTLTPDSILISGDKRTLDTVKFIETETIIIDNPEIKEVKANIASKHFKQQLKFQTKPILVRFSIEKFTENTLQLPVKVVNAPQNLFVKCFPESVTVRFLLAIKDFSLIKSDAFTVEVDYKSIEPDQNTLKPVIMSFPDKVRIQSMEPELVEFIILRND